MTTIGAVFVALYIASGLVTAFIAPRIGPNAFLGVRTSVTLSDRRIWDAANRIGGWILVACGAGLLPIVALMAVLEMDDGTARVLFLAYVVLTLIALGTWAVVYPTRLRKSLDAHSR